MKTIIDYLNTLPEPYRSKAISNTSETYYNYKVNSKKEAVKLAFTWENSNEGFDYWDRVHSLLCISDTFKD